MFDSMARHLGTLPPGMPMSFELSPATVTREKLKFLKDRGVTRFSIGVQSFVTGETKTMGRPQSLAEVYEALGLIRETRAPVMNIDLIYGADVQSISSWRHSITEALAYEPEEIYLYPLYVRPLTGLEKIGRSPADHRLDLYRAGRELLRESGYRQISMRLFRRADGSPPAGDPEGPVYCCQEDGMVGIGAGARSYTKSVHYCTEYAVGRNGIDLIIADYSARSEEEHSSACYGCHLSIEEQQRRYVLKSILRIEGLSLPEYRRNFSREVSEDFPDLSDLFTFELATRKDDRIVLTDYGFERSDTIGPWLFSAEIVSSMNAFQWV